MAAVPPFGLATRTAGMRKELAMPTVPLPDEPSLEQLRNQAKDLRRAVLAGEPARSPRPPHARPARSRLHAAQLTWPAATVSPAGPASSATSRSSSATAASRPRPAPHGPADAPTGAPARREPTASCAWPACPTHDDQPERWAQARALLAEHPELTGGHVHAAAAAADTDGAAAHPRRRSRRRPPRGRPVPVAAAALPGLRPARPGDRARTPSWLPHGSCSTPAPTRTPATSGTACPRRSPC